MYLGFNTDDLAASSVRLGYPAIVRIFPPAEVDAGTNIETWVANLKSQIEELNKQGIAVFFSFKPSVQDTLSGKLDILFIKVGEACFELEQEYGIQNYATVWHEPENDIRTPNHPGNPFESADQYTEVFDIAYHCMKQGSRRYLKIGPVYMAYQWMDEIKSEFKVTNPASWIPANYDFLGADAYSDLWQGKKTTLAQHSGWLKIAAIAQANYADLIVVERGIKDQAQQATALQADFAYLHGMSGAFVLGMLYWDNKGQAGDWHLSPAAAKVWRTQNYLET